MMELETLRLDVAGHIARVTLNRPQALNAMNAAFWTDMIEVFDAIDADGSVRAVVLASTGKHFTAGLDLKWAAQGNLEDQRAEVARSREHFRRKVKKMQETFNVIDRCRVPVIAVVQGGCIGGGVDLVTACDIRIGTEDCFFTIQEINVGIVADVGTLQRIPYLLPQGLVRELAYTGRRFPADEALHHGFLNSAHDGADAALDAAMAMAREIAAKSPMAIAGVKQVLNHGRGRSLEDGLEYVAVWNAAMLPGEDSQIAITAQMTRQPAQFQDLKAG
ncbi:crotonase/enoyl-CoA hydratase family protein [Sphingoaurantiacus capsulatus]|uniref:Crotonase/enoyl-CoA hydratase family protein n=1 Tax=Sphingoaurantiacus capsulatus TaxID=1771310 RepID=A0ABV7X6K1_9SPHN